MSIDASNWQTERLWGCKAISEFAGVCPDTVRSWSKITGCPIKKIGGKFFVTKSALVTWLTEVIPA